MRHVLKFAAPLAVAGGMAGAAHAGELQLSIEIPKLAAAEYHKPYVAIWIEDGDHKVAANLAVWYDIDNKEGGEKWLKDVRQWWRRTGRELKLPADGLSSPTKPPGVNKVTFKTDAGPLASLKPGSYTLMVEAAREVGGKELVEIPFTLGADATLTATGKTELGAITLKLTQ